MTSPTARARLRIGSPAQLALTVPHLLGFRPSESVVVVAASGPRRQLGLAMRLDLADVGDIPETTADLVDRLIRDGADEFLVVVFTDERPRPPVGGQRKVRLPHAQLVQAFRKLQLPMMDAILVSGDRAWSYVCFQRCCPSTGTLIEDGPDSDRIKATFLSAGTTVAETRESLVAVVDPPTGHAAERAAAALEVACDWMLGVSPGVRIRWLAKALDDGLEQCADPRGILAPEECARILCLLGDVALRDYVLVRLVCDIAPDDGSGGIGLDSDAHQRWRLLLLQLLRASVSVWDAPVCTLFAVVCYHAGDGVLVAAALDRALSSRPSYGLAQLISQLLDNQVPPKLVMATLRKSAQSLG